MTHNFVIFGSSWDLYKQSYSDLYQLENARYISDPSVNINKGIDKWLYKLQHNPHIYNRVHFPWKERMYPYYFKDDFENTKNNGENLVFVFQGGWLLNEYADYPAYLKKHYPLAKFVLFLQDLFRMIKGKDRIANLDIDQVRKEFDLILSFDQNDCEEYGFTYHPLVFSSYHGVIEDMPQSDVYFLGKAKNRFAEIIGCFEQLWRYNVDTDLWLVGVKPEEQVYKDKIHYVSSMAYLENLQHVLHCNCELEIMQAGGFGYTQRMCEVISLDKKLITNNRTVHEAPFYNSDYIFQIEKPSDITQEMCEKIKKRECVDYHYKENLSPIELLEFIEEKLRKA